MDTSPRHHVSTEQLFNRARAEEFYTWSRRWMEAERDLRPDDAVAALNGHFERMKKLGIAQIVDYVQKRRDGVKRGTDALKEDQVLPPDDPEFAPGFTKSTKFFRLEAESWLAKASVPKAR
jgi:hypothetical protein